MIKRDRLPVAAALCAWILTCAIILLPAIAGAEVIGWRTDGTGRYPDANPPREWSSEKNVVWKTALPGSSGASPAVLSDRLFVVSQPAELLCIRTSDGELMWQRTHTYRDVLGGKEAKKIADIHARKRALSDQVRQLEQEYRKLARKKPRPEKRLQDLSNSIAELKTRAGQIVPTHPAIPRYDPGRDAGNAASTPVTDGLNVYSVFGTGIVSSHTIEGKRRWMRFVETPVTDYGHASSPVLVGGKLVVHLVDLVALDADSGDEIWRVKLPARHATPIATRIGGVDVLLTAAGAIVSVADGKTLAKGLFGLHIPSPVVHDGIVYVHQHDKIKAIRLPESPEETLDPEVLWEVGSRDAKDVLVSSPVYHEGLLYGVNRSGVFKVIDARTGGLVYRERLSLRARIYTSPTLAGGHIHVSANDGATAILAPGREYKEIARNDLEPFTSTPVFVGKRMYVRGHQHLYCVGE